MTISDDVQIPGAVASRRSLITLRDVAVHYPVKEGVLQRVTSYVKAVVDPPPVTIATFPSKRHSSSTLFFIIIPH